MATETETPDARVATSQTPHPFSGLIEAQFAALPAHVERRESDPQYFQSWEEHDMTVITRNVRHISVLGALCADWSE